MKMDAGMISSSNERLCFFLCWGETINLNKKYKLIYQNLDIFAQINTKRLLKKVRELELMLVAIKFLYFIPFLDNRSSDQMRL